MFDMFKQQYPNVKCCKESYRKIFTTRFNVSFGYPRQDTCSKCDEIRAKIEGNPNEDEKRELMEELDNHQASAKVFYRRKISKSQESLTYNTRAAIAFDFWKNLRTPNVTTNDVFYRRQLSFHAFNIHILGQNEVNVYTYDETVAKRGADDVSSMLFQFIQHYLPEDVEHLDLFCDSCPAQN